MTMDELCKAEPGAFKDFIKQSEAFFENEEKERKERIRYRLKNPLTAEEAAARIVKRFGKSLSVMAD